MEWQPIDTAPKDGTEVLLWCVNEYTIGYWDQGTVSEGWCDSRDGEQLRDDQRTTSYAPTHWAPLNPPQK